MNDSNNPTFSILVPFYNVQDYIAQCIDSLLAQTYENFEILCVDDCGNDASLKIVESYAQQDSRIKIIKHEHNKGLGTARNTALKVAKGKYIACVDSDDFVEEEMLEKSFEIFDANPDLDSVWFKIMTYFQNENKYDIHPWHKVLYNTKGGFIDLTPEIVMNYPPNAWNKIYKKDFIEKHNIKWSDGKLYEDLEFFCEFYFQSDRTYLIDDCLYNYRVRRGSIMNKSIIDNRRIEDIFDVTVNIYNYLKEHNIFEQTKKGFYKLVIRNVNFFIREPRYNERVKQAAKIMLEKINFKEEFPNG